MSSWDRRSTVTGNARSVRSSRRENRPRCTSGLEPATPLPSAIQQKVFLFSPEFRLLLLARRVRAGDREGTALESLHGAGPRHCPAACGHTRSRGSAAAAPTPAPVGAALSGPLRQSGAPAQPYLAAAPRRAEAGAAWPLRDSAGAQRAAAAPASSRRSPGPSRGRPRGNARPVGVERGDPRGCRTVGAAGERRRG